MRRIAVLIASLPLIIAAAVPGSNQDAGVDGKSQRDDQRLLCKASSPPTGTRIGSRRICLTNVEWQMLDRIGWASYHLGTSHLLFNSAPPSP